jgi:hypothetical protein
MGGGVTYRITFSGRDFGAKIQKRPRNSKNWLKKFEKVGAEIQKKFAITWR